jgi:hypothetical protein
MWQLSENELDEGYQEHAKIKGISTESLDIRVHPFLLFVDVTQTDAYVAAIMQH